MVKRAREIPDPANWPTEEEYFKGITESGEPPALISKHIYEDWKKDKIPLVEQRDRRAAEAADEMRLQADLQQYTVNQKVVTFYEGLIDLGLEGIEELKANGPSSLNRRDAETQSNAETKSSNNANPNARPQTRKYKNAHTRASGVSRTALKMSTSSKGPQDVGRDMLFQLLSPSATACGSGEGTDENDAARVFDSEPTSHDEQQTNDREFIRANLCSSVDNKTNRADKNVVPDINEMMRGVNDNDIRMRAEFNLPKFESRSDERARHEVASGPYDSPVQQQKQKYGSPQSRDAVDNKTNHANSESTNKSRESLCDSVVNKNGRTEKDPLRSLTAREKIGLALKAAPRMAKAVEAARNAQEKLIESAKMCDRHRMFRLDRAHAVVADTLLYLEKGFKDLNYGGWMPFRYPDQWLMFCGMMRRVLAANGLITPKRPDEWRKFLEETPYVDAEEDQHPILEPEWKMPKSYSFLPRFMAIKNMTILRKLFKKVQSGGRINWHWYRDPD